MDSTYCSAFNLRNFLKYKKINNKYLFKINESYKILFQNNLLNDIKYSSIELFDCSFNSGISPNKASIGRMLVRYIADTLMGHPFSQAIIKNESSIIENVNNSNLHKQITNALSLNLSTSDFSDNEICLSLLEQFINQSPERFFNEEENIEYKFPFCKSDFITLFIKMSSDITLDERSSLTNKSSYDILKTIFQNKPNITFNDTNSTLKINQKIWRIKIELL